MQQIRLDPLLAIDIADQIHSFLKDMPASDVNDVLIIGGDDTGEPLQEAEVRVTLHTTCNT